jgi:hypothetical protein
VGFWLKSVDMLTGFVTTIDAKIPRGRRHRLVASFLSVGLVYYSLCLSLDVMYAMGSNRVERILQGSSGKPNMLLFVLDQWRYDWDGSTEDTPTGKNPLLLCPI